MSKRVPNDIEILTFVTKFAIFPKIELTVFFNPFISDSVMKLPSCATGMLSFDYS